VAPGGLAAQKERGGAGESAGLIEFSWVWDSRPLTRS
jgi:hypothetical protein